MTWSVVQADCLDFLRQLSPDSVDLVFGSPPYEQARLYLEGGKNLGVARKTEAWVSWMVEAYTAAGPACNGVIAFVVAGQTRNYRYSAGPLLLAADLCRRGFNLRCPPIYHRVGIPGSGGPDWLRNDYEMIICVTRPGKLPWSDNTAAGHPPKWAPGGEMSYRLTSGERRNQWGGSHAVTGKTGPTDKAQNEGQRPSHKLRTKGGGHQNGDTPNGDTYEPPVLANPGNRIEQHYELTASQLAALAQGTGDIVSLKVGGGLMGNALCHENEAPFPEQLADVFIRSWCPPGGTVCDPFSGSGTTGAVAVRHGRNFLGCDLRQSQVELSRKRIATETPLGLYS